LKALEGRLDRRQASVAHLRRVGPGDDPLVDRLLAFAQGEPVDFENVEVEHSGLTEFQRRVRAQCRQIPYGETRTYGQLAAAAGRPGAARAVGTVMSQNRVPLVVPCHRVVASGGGLGGFSAPQGINMKRRLLAMEQAAARVLG
jgi:methylated-DNA-[protein]-cysteine S-methyltransferase